MLVAIPSNAFHAIFTGVAAFPSFSFGLDGEAQVCVCVFCKAWIRFMQGIWSLGHLAGSQSPGVHVALCVCTVCMCMYVYVCMYVCVCTV